jgi:hypothetical protein
MEIVTERRTTRSSVAKDDPKAERRWTSCEFRQSPVGTPAASAPAASSPGQPPVQSQWTYSPLSSPNESSDHSLVSASVPATSTTDNVFEDGLGTDGSYDYCARCSNGGDLICCDTCPLAYHSQCLDVESSPSDTWNCPVCEAELQVPHGRKVPG